ncbi:MAG TPA: hypothetical protein VGM54_26285 [Chthoniobacter sp.]
MKQTIHQWIDTLPDGTPELLALYERARLNRAVMEAMRSVERGDVFTADEIRSRFDARCQAEGSA